MKEAIEERGQQSANRRQNENALWNIMNMI